MRHLIRISLPGNNHIVPCLHLRQVITPHSTNPASSLGDVLFQIPSQHQIDKINVYVDHHNASCSLLGTLFPGISTPVPLLKCNSTSCNIVQEIFSPYAWTQRMNTTITMSNYYLGQLTKKLLYLNYATRKKPLSIIHMSSWDELLLCIFFPY